MHFTAFPNLQKATPKVREDQKTFQVSEHPHINHVFICLGCVVQSSWDLAYQMFLLSVSGVLLIDPKALRSRVVSYKLNSTPTL